MNETVRITYKAARRIAVLTVGSTLLALGIVMIVMPGPAIILIPVGLAVLAMEFAWARFWLAKIRRGLSAQGANHRARRAQRHRDRHL